MSSPSSYKLTTDHKSAIIKTAITVVTQGLSMVICTELLHVNKLLLHREQGLIDFQALLLSGMLTMLRVVFPEMYLQKSNSVLPLTGIHYICTLKVV